MSKPRFDRVERERRKSITNDRRFTKNDAFYRVENYFTKIGLKNVDSLIVSQPKYMTTRVYFKRK
jgi:endothelin-converting enzyme/putative endopeptidase